jgi:hypothetical protein
VLEGRGRTPPWWFRSAAGRGPPILKRRKSLGPSAFVFTSPAGEYVDSFKTAWESLLLVANGHDTKRAKHAARVDREKLRQIDLHWHDLCQSDLRKVARPAGLVHARVEQRETRRELERAVASQTASAAWRARQDSNLRPPA